MPVRIHFRSPSAGPLPPPQWWPNLPNSPPPSFPFLPPYLRCPSTLSGIRTSYIDHKPATLIRPQFFDEFSNRKRYRRTVDDRDSQSQTNIGRSDKGLQVTGVSGVPILDSFLIALNRPRNNNTFYGTGMDMTGNVDVCTSAPSHAFILNRRNIACQYGGLQLVLWAGRTNWLYPVVMEAITVYLRGLQADMSFTMWVIIRNMIAAFNCIKKQYCIILPTRSPILLVKSTVFNSFIVWDRVFLVKILHLKFKLNKN